MIGASPRTEDLGGLVGLDDKGFIVTGEDAGRHPSFVEHRAGAPAAADHDSHPGLDTAAARDRIGQGDGSNAWASTGSAGTSVTGTAAASGTCERRTLTATAIATSPAPIR
jgi:hypothetical protein